MNKPFDAVIVAGGSGLRMGSNKIFLPLGTDSVLQRVVSAFDAVCGINNIIVVLKKEDISTAKELLSSFSNVIFAEGGANRTQSVESGLTKATAPIVLIHDGARPFVSPAHILDIVSAVAEFGSAIPALPITDSVRECKNSTVVGTFNRDNLYSVSTPQGFTTADIKKAFDLRGNTSYTDESELYSAKIAPAHIIAGDPNNRKLTTPAEYISTQLKIGCGYDLHRLERGSSIVLCGVTIPCKYKLIAHSDGDVCLHALIDAILSAIGERDIGTQFPDSDPRYKGISSELLLNQTMDMCNASNKKLQSINMIIVADNPKMQPHIADMCANLARITDIPLTSISISAKTTEQTLPNTIACNAIVTLL